MASPNNPLIIEMGLRQKFEELIEARQQEIRGHQSAISRAYVYIQAMQEAIKLLPKEDNGRGSPNLRVGSSAHKTMNAIRTAGRPLHIVDALEAIGMTNNKTNRISIGATLSRYARKGEIFRRAAPNTFALLIGKEPNLVEE